jgi:hypothetical protein
MSVTSTPVQQLTLSDVDFEHFESRTLLFTSDITNPTLAPAVAQMQMVLKIALADGWTDDEAFVLTTLPFTIPIAGLRLTNFDIGRNKLVEVEYSNLSQRTKDHLRDIVLATGRFPDGSYMFTIKLLTGPGGTILCDEQPIRLELRNLTRVELRSPQDGEFTNEFPFFQFFHEGTSVLLTVAELAPGQSREDAIVRKPAMLEVELQGQSSFLYTGGRPLERGKSYAWKVVSQSLGAGGSIVEVPSSIGVFTVASSETYRPSVDDMLLQQLQEALGPEYAGLIDQIRHSGFASTGTFTLNGTTITQAELLRLLIDLRNAPEPPEVTFE